MAKKQKEAAPIAAPQTQPVEPIQPYSRKRIMVKKYQPIPRFNSGCKNC